MQSFPPTFQMCLSKFASSHSAVATTMFHWKRWDTATCPLCQSLEETMAHVLLCPHTSSRETWTQQITQLQQWLTQSDIALVIQQCLLCTLTYYQSQPFWSCAPGLCCPVAHDQDHIGFWGFMVGRLTSKWMDIQGIYYSSTSSPRSASLWMVRLCRQIFLMTHAMWLSRNQQDSLIQRQCALTSNIAVIWDQF